MPQPPELITCKPSDILQQIATVAVRAEQILGMLEAKGIPLDMRTQHALELLAAQIDQAIVDAGEDDE